MSEDLNSADDRKVVSFRMPDDLHRRLKLVAVRDGKSIQEILNGLAGAYVTKKEGEASG